jgi:hypothetical protein
LAASDDLEGGAHELEEHQEDCAEGGGRKKEEGVLVGG